MSKPKLLITMGCSFTEGVGCFDYSILSDSLKDKLDKIVLPDFLYNGVHHFSDSILIENEHLHYPNFHEKGWPNRVGKKLGFDKVINLGLRGSANSAQVKTFYEKYVNTDFSGWDVTIIWLMSFSHRLSFYTQGEIKSFAKDKISDAYLEILAYDNQHDIEDAECHDMALEQVFYFKIMEQLCESKGYQILGFHYDLNDSKFFQKYYKGNNYIPCNVIRIEHSENHQIIHWNTMCDKISGHPTEAGYEIISDNMIDAIINKFPNLYELNYNDDIKWEWNGYPLRHPRILDIPII